MLGGTGTFGGQVVVAASSLSAYVGAAAGPLGLGLHVSGDPVGPMESLQE